MTQLLRWTSLAALLSLGSAARAQVTCDGAFALVDYVGFGWETGGILPSNAGDVLAFTAVATQIDAIFGVDLQNEEVTIYVSDLQSTGQFNAGTSWLIGYTGGHIEVYADPSDDHDWGTFPPNGQLGTFTNGTLLFEGDFTSFTVQMDLAGNAGAFEGLIDGVGGTVANACTDCAYTFGGIFGDAIAQLPDGYDLQIDGGLEVCETVPNDSESFGSIKALFHD
jgi:hypothetical protein